MSRLVDDLLLLAQADEGEFLRPSRIELRAVRARAVRRARATSRRPRFELGAVAGDAHRGRRGPPGPGAAQPAAQRDRAHRRGRRVGWASSTADGRARFIVEDDGPGIPPDQRAAVFDRFHRLDGARARDAGGAGLGLAIVQAIAHAHGGRAWADAAPSGGARFVLEIPVRTRSDDGPT